MDISKDKGLEQQNSTLINRTPEQRAESQQPADQFEANPKSFFEQTALKSAIETDLKEETPSQLACTPERPPVPGVSNTPKLKSVVAQESIKEESESVEAKSEAYLSIKNKNLGEQTT